MERLLLVAGGVDRKGVVFNITKILKKYKFNIEDSSMNLLRKTFSMIMLLSHDGKYDKKSFKNEIRDFMNKFEMDVDIRKISEKDMKEYKKQGNIYMVSINGADKPGIVNKIAGVISRNKGNVIGLETKSSESVVPHAYYMFLEVDVPQGVSAKKLEKELRSEGEKLGVHVGIKKVDEDIL